MNKFLTMYGVSAEIDTAESGATTENWAVLGEGIENLAEALNEVVYSGFYLHNGGCLLYTSDAADEILGG